MNTLLIVMAAWSCPAFDQPELTGSVDNSDLGEASGLVHIASNEGFWAHNDSGDQARLFAFDRSGKDLGQLILEGVGACLLYTSPSPRDRTRSRMPSSA